ncbi:hypothetical protein D9B73_02915 [Serratia marcescens]|nr:hypothetical protein C7M66_11970 [Serratia marcescens]AXX22723.1 hypothetical protein C7M65_01160 [Serratia marcescens]RTE97822.1 hypothetical protein C7M70_17190 [Serratia marcescens]RTF04244.1 hypothetical protein C7M68_07435 [Serratia marcescens]RTF10665.1 hypothetical protein C7M69_20180 [Serratia marcescens]
MLRRDPCQCWRSGGKCRIGSSCKFMHPMHA